MTVLITFARLLPPANEVWEKVIFSEACVKNSVRGGACMVAGGVGGMHGCRGRACVVAGGHAWLTGGMHG